MQVVWSGRPGWAGTGMMRRGLLRQERYVRARSVVTSRGTVAAWPARRVVYRRARESFVSVVIGEAGEVARAHDRQGKNWQAWP